jgi:hypothetical protein
MDPSRNPGLTFRAKVTSESGAFVVGGVDSAAGEMSGKRQAKARNELNILG